MAFLGGVGKFFSNVIKPIGTSLLTGAGAAGAAVVLKKLLGPNIQSMFEAGTKGLQSILSKIPLVGPLVSNLVGKYAPQLSNVAQWAMGGLEGLLGRIFGSNTSRPVPGAPAGTNVVVPPLTSRAGEILQNTPGLGTLGSAAIGAAVGAVGTAAVNAYNNSSSSGGPTYDGKFPAYPKAPTDPKDLAAQNKFQEQMFEFQQASQNMNMFWSMMTTTAKAMKDTADKIIQNFR